MTARSLGGPGAAGQRLRENKEAALRRAKEVWQGPGEYAMIGCKHRDSSEGRWHNSYHSVAAMADYIEYYQPKKIEVLRLEQQYPVTEDEMNRAYAALRDALNRMPRTSLGGKYKDTYALAAHLGKFENPSEEQIHDAFFDGYSALNAGPRTRLDSHGFKDSYELATVIGKMIGKVSHYGESAEPRARKLAEGVENVCPKCAALANELRATIEGATTLDSQDQEGLQKVLDHIESVAHDPEHWVDAEDKVEGALSGVTHLLDPSKPEAKRIINGLKKLGHMIAIRHDETAPMMEDYQNGSNRSQSSGTTTGSTTSTMGTSTMGTSTAAMTSGTVRTGTGTSGSNSLQGAPQAPQQGAPQGNQQSTQQGAPQSVPQGTPQAPQQGAPQGNQQGATQPPQGNSTAAPQGAPGTQQKPGAPVNPIDLQKAKTLADKIKATNPNGVQANGMEQAVSKVIGSVGKTGKDVPEFTDLVRNQLGDAVKESRIRNTRRKH